MQWVSWIWISFLKILCFGVFNAKLHFPFCPTPRGGPICTLLFSLSFLPVPYLQSLSSVGSLIALGEGVQEEVCHSLGTQAKVASCLPHNAV